MRGNEINRKFDTQLSIPFQSKYFFLIFEITFYSIGSNMAFDFHTGIFNYNNIPIPDLDGLTPNQMHSIIYDLFGENCPLSIKKEINNEILDQLSLFRLCEEFLKIIQRDKALILTPNGNLKKVIVKELYDHRFILIDAFESGLSKNYIEDDVYTVRITNIICLLSGLIRKTKNTLVLTSKGKQLLASDKRAELFNLILITYIKKYNWSYLGTYDDELTGNLGIGYVLILLMKYGNSEKSFEYYASMYLKAFPTLIKNFPENKWSTPLEDLIRCFKNRTFMDFLFWFNFANAEDLNTFYRDDSAKVLVGESLKGVFTLNL
jgi:hypothetical protein